MGLKIWFTTWLLAHSSIHLWNFIGIRNETNPSLALNLVHVQPQSDRIYLQIIHVPIHLKFYPLRFLMIFPNLDPVHPPETPHHTGLVIWLWVRIGYQQNLDG